jgi:type IX secretion system PorP/SprF family membrane protein
MFRKILYSVLFFAGFVKLNAQDIQFTQFYAAPMFLNPAFTGLTYEHRFTVNARNQWTGINTAYKTAMAAYDYNVSALNSGIGGFYWQDRAGTSNLVTQQGGLNYSYRVKTSKYSEFRMGTTIGYSTKKIDYTRLIFNDQLISNAPISNDAQKAERVNYLDLALGALYNSTNYWFGFSAKHLNQPNVSITGDIEALPVYYSAHGGYRYIISARGAGRTKLEEFISASVHYRRQKRYDQLDIGAYYFKSFLNLGVWYRGLPFKKYKPGYTNRESIALLVGLEIPDKNFRVGYSYDATISKLGISNSQATHEISLVFEVAQKRKKNKRVLVSCPKF